jgi:hypothetical protein
MEVTSSKDPIVFGIYVTASQGCSHATKILEDVLAFKSDVDSITILETVGTDCVDQQEADPKLKSLPHEMVDSSNEFEMRLRALHLNQGTYTLVLEDHMSIRSDFFTSLRAFLETYVEIPALSFYGRNGTSDNFGSRALYKWVFGLASLENWPRSPEPVCSAFLMNNHFFSEYERGLGRNLAIGEMESHVLPYIVPRARGFTPKQIQVRHYQEVSVSQAIMAIYENARISGHFEKKTNLFKWLIILTQRHFFRFLKLTRVPNGSASDLVGAFGLACVGFVGGVAGRYTTLGNAFRRLASTHTQ